MSHAREQIDHRAAIHRRTAPLRIAMTPVPCKILLQSEADRHTNLRIHFQDWMAVQFSSKISQDSHFPIGLISTIKKA
jgi:hypothetical protein